MTPTSANPTRTLTALGGADQQTIVNGGIAGALAATISVPLDGRGVELCVAMARARVAKEHFDLAMTKAMR